MTNYCPVCSHPLEKCLELTILGKYDAPLQMCKFCEWAGFISPHWLNESYSTAIAATDTGAVQRSLANTICLSNILLTTNLHLGSCLDYGGGCGLFVRLMRDKGYNYFWYDKFSPNIYAQGFALEDAHTQFDTISLFEVIEHTEHPAEVFSKLINEFSPKLIVFSTELYKSSSLSKNWWYLSLDTGQHISFMTKNTLSHIASLFHYTYFQFMGLHCFASDSSVFRNLLLPRFSASRLLLSMQKRKRKSQLKSKIFTDNTSILAKVRDSRD